MAQRVFISTLPPWTGAGEICRVMRFVIRSFHEVRNDETCSYVPPQKLRNFHCMLQRRIWWLRGLRRRSAAARLLGLRVQILLGAWMSISCECCVLSGRSFCDGPIRRPEESYRVWCVWVRVISKPQPLARVGLLRHKRKKMFLLTSAPTWRLFMTFDIWIFFENLSRK
jgi:hypothetical protein